MTVHIIAPAEQCSVDGADWKGDNGDDYARVRKLFESTGFHSIKVHANSTKN